MKLALKGKTTEERKFVERVLELCDNIVVSNSILKEYASVVGWHRKKGWYPEIGFKEIWDEFKSYVRKSFGKSIKIVKKSKIKAKKRRLGIDTKEDERLKSTYKDDYKLIECAIGCCHEKVVVISRDYDLLGSKVLIIKGKTILFKTPEDYLKQRGVQ